MAGRARLLPISQRFGDPHEPSHLCVTRSSPQASWTSTNQHKPRTWEQRLEPASSHLKPGCVMVVNFIFKLSCSNFPPTQALTIRLDSLSAYTMNKVPVGVDGRFRLGDVLGSGSYEREYRILKQLEGGIGIPCTLWFGRESVYHAMVLELLGPSLHQLFLANDRKFSLLHVMNIGDQLLSRLEYIHSHNYVHGDIKPQNILMGLGNLRHTTFIIDFGITKTYWNTKTGDHVPFCHGVEPGRCDDLESLTYMLIYFLRGSLPWLTSDDEKLSGSTILERKAHATIADICQDIPVEFATILIYTCSLTFAEDPDYDHLHSLLHNIHASLPAPATSILDFSQLSDPAIHPPDQCWVAEAILPCPPKEMRRLTRVLFARLHLRNGSPRLSYLSADFDGVLLSARLEDVVRKAHGHSLFFSTDVDKGFQDADLIFVFIKTLTKKSSVGAGFATNLNRSKTLEHSKSVARHDINIFGIVR
ncbi:kinase-like domain-containing protein [Suillus tomentosus]|nr:kinase-like domain-containing protein [Suillus tomentosus]